MVWRETPAWSARSAGYDGASRRARSTLVRVGSDRAWPNRARASVYVEAFTATRVQILLNSSKGVLAPIAPSLNRHRPSKSGDRIFPDPRLGHVAEALPPR